jgi:2-iminobutanoate/2-iminopropanoate deaminase
MTVGMPAHRGLVHVSGQLGTDPETGMLVPGGFGAQMRQALDNLAAGLAAAGSGLDHVVKAQIELVDEADFDVMNEVYGERFHEPRPARSSFGVAFLPRGARVQIEALAAVDSHGSDQAAVVSRRGPAPTASYPHAHVHGRRVWVTAQAGRDPTSGEMVAGAPTPQMDQAISNLAAILADCGASLAGVVHSQIMCLHPEDLDELAQTFERRFAPRPPPGSWVGVSFLAAEPGVHPIRLQLDCVAALD